MKVRDLLKELDTLNSVWTDDLSEGKDPYYGKRILVIG